MSLQARPSRDHVAKSAPQPAPTPTPPPDNDKDIQAETLVSIPDEKDEAEAVAATKDLQPEREASAKDYLVRSRLSHPQILLQHS
jgi:hypothetical protein